MERANFGFRLSWKWRDGANAGKGDAMKLDIRHDPGGGRFFASIGGEEATLLYSEAADKTLKPIYSDGMDAPYDNAVDHRHNFCIAFLA